MRQPCDAQKPQFGIDGHLVSAYRQGQVHVLGSTLEGSERHVLHHVLRERVGLEGLVELRRVLDAELYVVFVGCGEAVTIASHVLLFHFDGGRVGAVAIVVELVALCAHLYIIFCGQSVDVHVESVGGFFQMEGEVAARGDVEDLSARRQRDALRIGAADGGLPPLRSSEGFAGVSVCNPEIPALCQLLLQGVGARHRVLFERDGRRQNRLVVGVAQVERILLDGRQSDHIAPVIAVGDKLKDIGSGGTHLEALCPLVVPWGIIHGCHLGFFARCIDDFVLVSISELDETAVGGVFEIEWLVDIQHNLIPVSAGLAIVGQVIFIAAGNRLDLRLRPYVFLATADVERHSVFVGRQDEGVVSREIQLVVATSSLKRQVLMVAVVDESVVVTVNACQDRPRFVLNPESAGFVFGVVCLGQLVGAVLLVAGELFFGTLPVEARQLFHVERKLLRIDGEHIRARHVHGETGSVLLRHQREVLAVSSTYPTIPFWSGQLERSATPCVNEADANLPISV